MVAVHTVHTYTQAVTFLLRAHIDGRIVYMSIHMNACCMEGGLTEW